MVGTVGPISALAVSCLTALTGVFIGPAPDTNSRSGFVGTSAFTTDLQAVRDATSAWRSALDSRGSLRTSRDVAARIIKAAKGRVCDEVLSVDEAYFVLVSDSPADQQFGDFLGDLLSDGARLFRRWDVDVDGVLSHSELRLAVTAFVRRGFSQGVDWVLLAHKLLQRVEAPVERWRNLLNRCPFCVRDLGLVRPLHLLLASVLLEVVCVFAALHGFSYKKRWSDDVCSADVCRGRLFSRPAAHGPKQQKLVPSTPPSTALYDPPMTPTDFWCNDDAQECRLGKFDEEQVRALTALLLARATQVAADDVSLATEAERMDETRVGSLGCASGSPNLSQILRELKLHLGEDAPRICILGGTEFSSQRAENIVKIFAGELGRVVPSGAWFLTCGLPGVQRTFAEHCTHAHRVRHIVPTGQTSDSSAGSDIMIDVDSQDCHEIFSKVGDIFVIIDDGRGLSENAPRLASFWSSLGSHNSPMVVPLAPTSVALQHEPEAAIELAAEAAAEEVRAKLVAAELIDDIHQGARQSNVPEGPLKREQSAGGRDTFFQRSESCGRRPVLISGRGEDVARHFIGSAVADSQQLCDDDRRSLGSPQSSTKPHISSAAAAAFAHVGESVVAAGSDAAAFATASTSASAEFQPEMQTEDLSTRARNAVLVGRRVAAEAACGSDGFSDSCDMSEGEMRALTDAGGKSELTRVSSSSKTNVRTEVVRSITTRRIYAGDRSQLPEDMRSNRSMRSERSGIFVASRSQSGVVGVDPEAVHRQEELLAQVNRVASQGVAKATNLLQQMNGIHGGDAEGSRRGPSSSRCETEGDVSTSIRSVGVKDSPCTSAKWTDSTDSGFSFDLSPPAIQEDYPTTDFTSATTAAATTLTAGPVVRTRSAPEPAEIFSIATTPRLEEHSNSPRNASLSRGDDSPASPSSASTKWWTDSGALAALARSRTVDFSQSNPLTPPSQDGRDVVAWSSVTPQAVARLSRAASRSPSQSTASAVETAPRSAIRRAATSSSGAG